LTNILHDLRVSLATLRLFITSQEVFMKQLSHPELALLLALLAAWPVLGVMHKHVPWMVSKKYQLVIPKI